jgi:hypothetical protein
VTFEANNVGATAHELVIVDTDMAPDALVVENGKVNEAASGTLVGEIEVDELPPGASASGTFDLQPGKYVLIFVVQ